MFSGVEEGRGPLVLVVVNRPSGCHRAVDGASSALDQRDSPFNRVSTIIVETHSIALVSKAFRL